MTVSELIAKLQEMPGRARLSVLKIRIAGGDHLYDMSGVKYCEACGEYKPPQAFTQEAECKQCFHKAKRGGLPPKKPVRIGRRKTAKSALKIPRGPSIEERELLKAIADAHLYWGRHDVAEVTDLAAFRDDRAASVSPKDLP